MNKTREQKAASLLSKMRWKKIATIIRMLRFGRAYSVRLACGHQLRPTLEEAAWKQLFIGKRIQCKECHK